MVARIRDGLVAITEENDGVFGAALLHSRRQDGNQGELNVTHWSTDQSCSYHLGFLLLLVVILSLSLKNTQHANICLLMPAGRFIY